LHRENACPTATRFTDVAGLAAADWTALCVAANTPDNTPARRSAGLTCVTVAAHRLELDYRGGRWFESTAAHHDLISRNVLDANS